MKWLRRKLLNWLNDRGDIYPVEVSSSPIARVGVDVEGLSFNVMPASGGTIVQIRHQYDHKNDRQKLVTHVIPDGENIAERVGEIVSMEILRA
jgi:hypothetical protein